MIGADLIRSSLALCPGTRPIQLSMARPFHELSDLSGEVLLGEAMLSLMSASSLRSQSETFFCKLSTFFMTLYPPI